MINILQTLGKLTKIDSWIFQKLRSSRKTDELENYLGNLNFGPFVLSLTETWLSDLQIFNLLKIDCFQKPITCKSTQKGGGVVAV